jgi:hypothetical protein
LKDFSLSTLGDGKVPGCVTAKIPGIILYKKWETCTDPVRVKTPGAQAKFFDKKTLAEGKIPGALYLSDISKRHLL